ncbi:hypothetical protein FRAHR75_210088 [Frankia sp. Hr75.2]|nr:hypothetical protein FRAHR75_210088 [Frankia sp. Hr75.2]
MPPNPHRTRPRHPVQPFPSDLPGGSTDARKQEYRTYRGHVNNQLPGIGTHGSRDIGPFHDPGHRIRKRGDHRRHLGGTGEKHRRKGKPAGGRTGRSK